MRSRFVTPGPLGIPLALHLVSFGVLTLATVASAQQPATGSALSSEPSPSVNTPLAIDAGRGTTRPSGESARVLPGAVPAIEPTAPATAGSAAPPLPLESGQRSAPLPVAERLPLGPPPSAGGSRSTTPVPSAAGALGGADAVANDNGGSGWLPSFLDPRQSAVARTLGSLVLVLGLAWIVVSLMRRASGPFAGGRRPSGVVQVLARYPVGRGQSVLLLQVGRRVLCVHQASGAMRTLADISDRDEVADLVGRIEGQSSSAFVAMLNGAAGRMERGAPSPGSAIRSRAVRTSEAPVVETIDLTRSRAGLSRLLAGRQSR